MLMTLLILTSMLKKFKRLISFNLNEYIHISAQFLFFSLKFPIIFLGKMVLVDHEKTV